MSSLIIYAIIAVAALGIIAALIYAFKRDAQNERIKTAKVLMLKQSLPASQSYHDASAEVNATLEGIAGSSFEVDDAYHRNHISVSGDRNGFYGTNNIGPP